MDEKHQSSQEMYDEEWKRRVRRKGRMRVKGGVVWGEVDGLGSLPVGNTLAFADDEVRRGDGRLRRVT